MEKSKLLTITVIGLLLLNIGTLSFLFLKKPNEHRPRMERGEGPKKVILERLHFDKNQENDFLKLIELHKSAIKANDEAIKNAKNELYLLLSKKVLNVSKKDSLLTVIATHQKEIEDTHFKHFESIKKLCHEDQLDYFNDLSRDLGKLFAPKKPDGPRPEARP